MVEHLVHIKNVIPVSTRWDSSNYQPTDKVWSSCWLSYIPLPAHSSSSFSSPHPPPPPILLFLQRRPCKLASFHSTDVSVPIGLSLRGDVLAILWNTPNTRTRAHTHIRRRSQKHPNTRCDTAVVAAGVDVCAHSHPRSLALSCSFLFLCVCVQMTEKLREEVERACVCTHNTSCVTTWRSLDPPELSSWVWEGCHHVPEAGGINTCSERNCHVCLSMSVSAPIVDFSYWVWIWNKESCD